MYFDFMKFFCAFVSSPSNIANNITKTPKNVKFIKEKTAKPIPNFLVIACTVTAV
jgi:hypothetical protein